MDNQVVKGFNKTREELKNVTNSLWLPLEDYLTENEEFTNKIKKDSWFAIRQRVVKGPLNFFREEEVIENEPPQEKGKEQEIKEVEIDFLCDFTTVKNNIGSSCSNYVFKDSNRCKKHQSYDQKEFRYSQSNEQCSFLIVSKKVGTRCSNLALFDKETNSVVGRCFLHLNKKQRKFDSVNENTCRFVLTQQSKKGLLCGKKCGEEREYCDIHLKCLRMGELMRTFKVRLNPTSDDKKVYNDYFGCCRRTYNLCVNNEERDLDLVTLKKRFVTNPEEKYLKNVPSAIRTNVIRQYITAVKSNLSKQKAGKLQSFKMQFKRKKDTQCIELPKENTWINGSKLTFFPDKFPDGVRFHKHAFKDKLLRKYLSEGIVNHNLFLTKTKSNKYYLCIPYDVDKTKEEKANIVAIDPGEVSFITAFGADGKTLEMDGNRRKLIACFENIDRLRSKKTLLKNKLKEKKKIRKAKIKRGVVAKTEPPRINTEKLNRLTKLIKKKEEQVTNKIKDMHYKTIKHLLSYKKIYIPEFRTKQMISKKRTLTKPVRRALQSLSHYRFRIRLINKAELTNSEVIICKEDYTSKTCGCCFQQQTVSGRVYNCRSCGFSLSRDLNGSRNIFIKNYF